MERQTPSQSLKQKLQNDEIALGLWITLETPTVSEIAAQIGLDWVCIDTEHSGLDFQDIANHLRALNGTRTAALVRIPGIDQGLIQKVLGLGAHGILVPRVRTAEEVELAVRFAKYPPRGSRGMGIERSTAWGKGMRRVSEANEETMVVPMIETVDSGRNIDAIMRVPGIDGFFFGPADYSASVGFPGEWEGPGVAEQLIEIENRIREQRYPSGIVVKSPEDRNLRIQQGFRIIGLGVDSTIFVNAVTDLVNLIGRSQGGTS
jgi:2-keto-3-deoxy-L-rhamnonate aldolase RhmA